MFQLRPAIRLFGPVASIFLTAALTACAYIPTSAKPEITSVRPRIQGLSMEGIDLLLDLDVRNPYPVPIRTPRFRYNLAVEETPLFSAKEVATSDLPARKVGTATLPVRLRYADLWNVATGLRSANQASYKLDGAFLLDAAGRNFELPFVHDGILPIFRIPKIDVLNIKPSNVSLTGAKLAVDANVTNPNIFGIGMDDVGYVLRLGELELGRVGIANLKELGPGQSAQVSFVGETSAGRVARELLSGGSLGGVRLLPTGSLDTPYGPIRLPGQLSPSQ